MPPCWSKVFGLAAVAIFVLTAGLAKAGDSALDELRGRLDKVEKENAALKIRLQEMDQTRPTSAATQAKQDVPSQKGLDQLIDQAIEARAAKSDDSMKSEAKKKPDESQWYEVGTDLSMSATWKNGLFLATPHKDFTMHLGGWLQYDNVFWTESPGLRASPGSRPGASVGVASGAAQGGVGNLEDGTYFRRIRPMADGTFWENGEYTMVLALENDQFSTAGLDEFWVGAKDIPLIGTARFGHVKTPMGLEADMTGSSRTMTFMERSSYSEAIELNENFVTGLWLGNNYFDQHATSSFAAFRQDVGGASGAFFGDGQWGMQARLTALPLWACEGRHYLHVGLSGGWRNGTNNLATSPLHTFQLRARPELRDDVPAGSPSGSQIIPNADSNRMIDTGAIVARQDWVTGLELLYVRGPFSIQAEYGFNWVEDAIGFAPAGSALNPALAAATNYFFNGGYMQLAYTLTGESRSYDKRLGRLDSYYFGRQGLFTNAWFVRDEDGRLNWGLGAWEIAGRYSYVNLNDGSGLSRIQGGVMDGFTVALNWYLNDNMKLQFDWVYDHRYDMPSGSIPGFTSGYGMRVQFMF